MFWHDVLAFTSANVASEWHVTPLCCTHVIGTFVEQQ